MKLKLARYLLLCSALLVIFFAGKYALANLSYLKVDSYLARWQSTQQIEQDELDDALLATQSMLALHGHFPHYLNVAAKVSEWQSFKYKSDVAQYELSQRQALSYYQQSALLREHWPLTWVFMANIKANLNQFDDDFYFYLEQAMKYGPYTHEVNGQIAKLQLQHWGKLDRLSTKVGLEQIKRALLNNNSRYQVLQYAATINRRAVVCTVAKLNAIKAVTTHRLCR